MPEDEQGCQQDALCRIHRWLGVLEERIQALLQDNDPATMKAIEREQAANRHLMLMMRLFALREQYTKAKAAAEGKTRLDALLYTSDDE